MDIDRRLLLDCRKGDRRAQARLYRTCFPVLMAVCLRYERNEADAASVLNLSFLKILRHLDRYEVSVPFEAWTRRIVINTIIDEFRKNREVRELIQNVDFNAPAAPSGDRVEWSLAEAQFEAEQLEQLVQQLPAVSRKVFNLFAIDGYSHGEIAELLGISVNTSKWHLSFARRRLRELLQPTTSRLWRK